MKKLVTLSLLTAVVGSGLNAKAADPVKSTDSKASLQQQVNELQKNQTKIGIVSATDVGAAQESKDLQAAIMELRGKYEGQIKKIDAELQGLIQQAQSATQAKLKNRVEELQDKITQKQQERELAAQNAERGLQRDAQKLVQESQQRFLDAVKLVSERKGLDVVLQREQALYVKPGLNVDITKEVISQWDFDYAAYKAKQAASKSKAAPKK